MENKINTLKMENADLISEINAANALIDRQKNDLISKDNLIVKIEHDIQELQHEVEVARQKHAEQMEHLSSEHLNERRAWESMKAN